MGYQKHDQNSRDVSNNYRKGKTKKRISTDNGKIHIKVRVKDVLLTCCDNLKGISEALKVAFHLNQRLLKSMKEISLELKIKYFSYIQKECLQETFRKQYIKCFIVI